MKHLILAAALALTMTACTPTQTQQPASPPDTSVLQAYHWMLTGATDATGQKIDVLFVREDHPVQLDFLETQVAVRNTCNAMSGAYQIEGDSLTIGPMRSTMKQCAEQKLNQLDREVGKRLTGKLQFSVSFADSPTDPPALKLILESGDRLVFSGRPTPETLYGEKGETIFLEVAAYTRPCSHPLIPGSQCLQVREVYYDKNGTKAGNSGKFENLYQPVEGYTHTPGIRNVLRIKRYNIPHPAADASKFAYVLDMVVESETVKP